MMRIGIDGQCLDAGVQHGFSAYVGNLLRTLRADNPEHDFCTWRCGARDRWRIPNQLWWDQVRVPWMASRQGVDLIHTPAFSTPIVASVPRVMTVMDLLYTRHPEWLPNSRARWYWGRWIPLTTRHAKAVIAPSHATKDDLIVHAGIPEQRITVIPLAVDPMFLKRPSASAVQAYRIRKALTMPYILYVGIIDGRKDLGTLVHAFSAVLPELKDSRLVIAGRVIQGRSYLREEIESAALGDLVRLPGYIPDEELPLLYAGASLFVYPSWMEGFGLPPLEAMAMGVPVVTYRSTSLPEVVGNAAVLVDSPFTTEMLADAMLRVLQDETFRDELVARGEDRANGRGWDHVARETMQVYETAVGKV